MEDYYERSDSGNAKLIVDLFGEKLRYDWEHQRWLVWKGNFWEEPKSGRVTNFAVDAAQYRMMSEDKAERAWARQSRNLAKIDNALTLAREIKPVDATNITWNGTHFLMACGNGVVNFKTGELSEGRKHDYITLHTPVNYNPEAKCPRWLKFLSEVFNDNKNLIDFIQRLAGYSFTGETREQVLAILTGEGANGKGRLINTLQKIAGEYSHTLPLNAMDARNHSPFALAGLVDRRIATASEMGEKLQLDSGRIKALTGEDSFTTSHKYKPEFTFYPKAKFWLLTNNLPIIEDYSSGLWRRLLIIPFTREFKGSERDNELEGKLLSEAEGILAWVVQGAMTWYKEGLQPPPEVMLSVLKYKEENDPIQAFISNRCIVGEDLEVRAGELFADYEAWCAIEREKPITSTMFGRRFIKLYSRRQDATGRFYVGLALNPSRVSL